MIIIFLVPSPQLPIKSLFLRLKVLAWQFSPRSISLFHTESMHTEQFDFCISGDPFVLPHTLRFSGAVVPALSSSQSPWSSVIALHDDASELDKAICVFCFAVFYFSAFAVWCFSLEEVCAMLYASNCGKILQP